MPPIRPRNAIGIPRRLAESHTFGIHPIGRSRHPLSSSASRFAQIATGASKSRPRICGSVKSRLEKQAARYSVGTNDPVENARRTSQRSNAAGAVVVVSAASAIAALFSWGQDQMSKTPSIDDDVGIKGAEADAVASTKIRLLEVTKHDADAATQWIIRGAQVYDITDFVACHPGGKVILRACGGSVDPYWKLFSIHDKPEVHRILDQYYIGEIDERDLDAHGKVNWSIVDIVADSINDPFGDDPERDPDLIVQTAKPCNAETPGALLRDFLTPARLFFVRNHLWVPRIEPGEHKLEIELSDGEEISYSIEDLKNKFQQHTITVTLQCAGNRRGHMNQTPNGKTSGLAWDVGAIGTADFTGVRLRDVLLVSGYDVQKACEACPNDPKNDRHIHFVAPSDTYEQSIPLHAALAPSSDVLLAWEMNGQAIPRDHGGPLRAIVPGSVATRSVKWVGKVRISSEESQSNWHSRDYKCFGPNVRAADLSSQDWEKAQSIQELPVQSAITSIVSNQDRGQVSISGFAYSGGGRKIVRVDVSADGGKTWKQAVLKEDSAKGARRWAWKLWEIDWAQDDVVSDAEFVVKAVDEAHNVQPQTFDGSWNFRGLLGNAWHRVPLSTKTEL